MILKGLSSIYPVPSALQPLNSEMAQSSINIFHAGIFPLQNFARDFFTPFDGVKTQRTCETSAARNMIASRDKKEKLPYPIHTTDSIGNRIQKYCYSYLDNHFSNLQITNNRQYKDGMYTGFLKDNDGSWIEYSHSKDRKCVFYRDSAGTEFKKEGLNLYFKYPDKREEYFTIDGEGAIKRVRKNADGSILAEEIARADGSYVLTKKDKAAEEQKQDPEMAQYEEIINQMARNAARGGEIKPLDEEELYLLTTLLSRINLAIIKNIEKYGVKIIIYDHKKPPKYINGEILPDKAAEQLKNKCLAGAYCEYNINEKIVKLLFLNTVLFQNGGRYNSADTVYNETGHAAGYMLAPKAHGRFEGGSIVISAAAVYNIDDPILKKLYNQYLERIERDSSKILLSNAASNIEEYFAVGFHLYYSLTGGDNILKERDPELYDYVEKKIKEAKDIELRK